MSNYNYEQTPSEGKYGSISKISRAEVLSVEISRIDQEKRKKETEERLKKRYDEVGEGQKTKKYINQGREDRLNGQYNLINITDEKEKNAYLIGFKQNGGIALAGKIVRDEISTKELISIGRNDFYAGIKISDLPEEVKNNEYYLLGYNSAAIEKMQSIINTDENATEVKKGRR